MRNPKLFLRDAEEIQQFYAGTTGMQPNLLQLSAGPVDLCIESYELAGVSLVWATSDGHTIWRDQQSSGTVQFGFLVECSGIFTTHGREITADEAMLWIPGEEMDYVMRGALYTLEIGVSADLVSEAGWCFSGQPLRRSSRRELAGLEHICRLAAVNAREEDPASVLFWRDNVLEALERTLEPWFSDEVKCTARQLTARRYAEIIRSADEVFEQLDHSEPLAIDTLADKIGVPKRTVFHAYRRILGIGPRRYFELKRLHALRRLLKQSQPDEMSITTAAARLGFADLGRMAARYREQFAEYPSVTLRK